MTNVGCGASHLTRAVEPVGAGASEPMLENHPRALAPLSEITRYRQRDDSTVALDTSSRITYPLFTHLGQHWVGSRWTGSDTVPKKISALRNAGWWAHQDSNLEPRDYESRALTIELWARRGPIVAVDARRPSPRRATSAAPAPARPGRSHRRGPG